MSFMSFRSPSQKSIAVVLLCLFMAVAEAAVAQMGGGKAGDPRVRKLLNAAGLKYDIISTGDFKLVMQVGDTDRTQVIVINSNTETYGNFEIREIWSPGYKPPGGTLGRDEVIQMLHDNFRRKLGAWQVLETDDKSTSIFSAKVSADLSGDDLTSVMRAVYQAADEMEKELTGKDDL